MLLTQFLLGGGSGAPMDGNIPLTVRVVRADTSAPMQGARVSLDGTGLVASTGTLGRTTFNLDANNASAEEGDDDYAYTVRVASMQGFETPEPVQARVLAATEITVELTPRALDVVAPPGTRVVKVYARRYGYQAVENISVQAILQTALPLRIPNAFGYEATQRVKTDAQGLAAFVMLIGHLYEIRFPDGTGTTVYVSPGDGEVNAEDLPTSAP